MSEIERKRDRGLVVLLGAGASVEAGIRTSREMSQHIYNDIAASRRADYALILGYVISKLQARNAKLGKSPFEPIEIEELFDTLKLLFRRDQLLVSEFVERWDATISEHFISFDTRAIQLALEHIVSKITSRQSRSSFSLSLSSSDYAALASALQPKSSFEQPRHGLSDPQQPFMDALLRHLEADPNKVGYLQPLVRSNRTRLIATLNYDVALESVAQQIGVEVDYGLDKWERQKRVDWRRKPCLRLLKLHGSINWTGHPEQLKVRADEIRPFEPRVMIFGGTENKLSSAGPFLQFLYRFERSLFNTGALLVVGYSFRDPHINAVLQRWILTRLNTQMTVIDPSPPNLWQLGFPMSEGTINLGDGRTRRVNAVRVIQKPASEGIMEYFQEPTLQLEAAQ